MQVRHDQTTGFFNVRCTHVLVFVNLRIKMYVRNLMPTIIAARMPTFCQTFTFENLEANVDMRRGREIERLASAGVR